MKYPSPDEIKRSLNTGTSVNTIARRYGITSAEVIELDHYGTVRPRTEVWADALRQQFPERFKQ